MHKQKVHEQVKIFNNKKGKPLKGLWNRGCTHFSVILQMSKATEIPGVLNCAPIGLCIEKCKSVCTKSMVTYKGSDTSTKALAECWKILLVLDP